MIASKCREQHHSRPLLRTGPSTLKRRLHACSFTPARTHAAYRTSPERRGPSAIAARHNRAGTAASQAAAEAEFAHHKLGIKRIGLLGRRGGLIKSRLNRSFVSWHLQKVPKTASFFYKQMKTLSKPFFNLNTDSLRGRVSQHATTRVVTADLLTNIGSV